MYPLVGQSVSWSVDQIVTLVCSNERISGCQLHSHFVCECCRSRYDRSCRSQNTHCGCSRCLQLVPFLHTATEFGKKITYGSGSIARYTLGSFGSFVGWLVPLMVLLVMVLTLFWRLKKIRWSNGNFLSAFPPT